MKQSNAVENLALVREVAVKFKVPFWLEHETLLGYVLRKDFLNSCDSISMGIRISDWKEEVLAELIGYGFELKYRYGELSCGLGYSLIRNDINVNLRFFYEAEKRLWNGCWIRRISDSVDFNLIKCVNMNFDLKQVDFHGMALDVPQNVESHLVEQYGVDWRIHNLEWNCAFEGDNVHRTNVLMRRYEYNSTVYLDGVFDMFHRGHVEVFKKARTFGRTLIVGVLADDDVAKYKRRPVVPLEDRAEIVRQCRLVDKVIVGSPLFISEELLDRNHIDIVVHGDDNKYETIYEIPIRRKIMRYVPYWKDCSTTSIRETARSQEQTGHKVN